jgi:lipopolysaccharide export system permease protein
MLRRIDRYIFGEIIAPFVLGVAAFTFILLIARILKLVELVINRGVPILETVRLFSYILPFFLEVTVPTAMLLAILIALGRLSADSEIIALRASGVSLVQMSLPIAIFVVIAWMATSLLSLYVRPWGHAATRETLYRIAKTRAAVGLKANVFNDDFERLVIYVDEIEPASSRLRRVVISDRRTPGTQSTLFARRGRLVPNEGEQTLMLRLRKGSIHTFNRTDGSYEKIDFGRYDVRLDLGVPDGSSHKHKKTAREMTLPTLRRVIAKKEAAGQSAASERVEFHRKFSIPFACIVFGLVAIPLGIQPVRAVRSRGFAVSLVITFCYYLFLTAGETLAKSEVVPAAPAMWLPNIVFGIFGLYLFVATTRERRLPDFGAPFWRLLRAAQRLKDRIRPPATSQESSQ